MPQKEGFFWGGGGALFTTQLRRHQDFELPPPHILTKMGCTLKKQFQNFSAVNPLRKFQKKNSPPPHHQGFGN